MLDGQTARVRRQVCWLVKQLGQVGRYVDRSKCWDR